LFDKLFDTSLEGGDLNQSHSRLKRAPVYLISNFITYLQEQITNSSPYDILYQNVLISLFMKSICYLGEDLMVEKIDFVFELLLDKIKMIPTLIILYIPF